MVSSSGAASHLLATDPLSSPVLHRLLRAGRLPCAVCERQVQFVNTVPKIAIPLIHPSAIWLSYSNQPASVGRGLLRCGILIWPMSAPGQERRTKPSRSFVRCLLYLQKRTTGQTSRFVPIVDLRPDDRSMFN